MTLDTTVLALAAGHLLGDFVLQTDGLSARKRRHAGWLVLHVALVAAVTWLLLGAAGAWPLAVALFGLHLVIDVVKRVADPPAPATADTAVAKARAARAWRWFLGDQALHLLALLLLAFAAQRSPWLAVPGNAWAARWPGGYDAFLVLVLGATLAVRGAGVLLQHQMAWFAADLSPAVRAGLPRGGRTVGELERALVLLFVLAGRPEGAGFVVAAKAVFRIGDLTRQQDKDHAEYIMIGTLRSFVYALVAAFATRWLLDHAAF